VRTPLDRLDIAEALRKRLQELGIRDVEGIVEADAATLAKAVGDRAEAAKLVEAARKLLGSTPAPAVRTPLDRLDMDEALRKRLQEAGIRDVEAIVESDAATLARVVGDRAAAAKLVEAARTLLGNPTPPNRNATRPRRTRPPRKKGGS